MPSEARMRCGLESTHALKLTPERPGIQSQSKMRLHCQKNKYEYKQSD